MGCRVIEQDEHHQLYNLGWATTEKTKQQIVESIQADFSVKYPGKKLVANLGHRLVRFDVVDDADAC